MQRGQVEEVSCVKMLILLVKWGIFYKFAQIAQTSWDLSKPPPIPQGSPLGRLTCGIGHGCDRSQEHGFLSILKFQ